MAYRNPEDVIRYRLTHKARHNELQRKYYNANRIEISSKFKNPEHRAKIRAKLKSRKEQAVAYLGGQCSNCHGKFHPSVYDFHHINPVEKDYGIATMLMRKWTDIQQELDKCILLCANCHRLEHYDTLAPEFAEEESAS